MVTKIKSKKGKKGKKGTSKGKKGKGKGKKGKGKSTKDMDDPTDSITTSHPDLDDLSDNINDIIERRKLLKPSNPSSFNIKSDTGDFTDEFLSSIPGFDSLHPENNKRALMMFIANTSEENAKTKAQLQKLTDENDKMQGQIMVHVSQEDADADIDAGIQNADKINKLHEEIANLLTEVQTLSAQTKDPKNLIDEKLTNQQTDLQDSDEKIKWFRNAIRKREETLNFQESVIENFFSNVQHKEQSDEILQEMSNKILELNIEIGQTDFNIEALKTLLNHKVGMGQTSDGEEIFQTLLNQITEKLASSKDASLSNIQLLYFQIQDLVDSVYNLIGAKEDSDENK